MRVQVTAGNADGEVKAVSAAVRPDQPDRRRSRPPPRSSPARSSAARALSVTRGQWTDTPLNFTYVWQRDKGSGFTKIAGATTASYPPIVTDVAACLRVMVSARNVAGTSVTPATSNTVGAVTGAPPVNTASRRSPARPHVAAS